MAQAAAGALATLGKVAFGMAAVVAVRDNFFYNVEGGHRGVIFDRFRGILPNVDDEGTHFIMPFLQIPYIMDVRSRPRVISSVTGTKDLQMVNISLRVLSRPIESQLPTIYKTLGLDFDDRVLPSLGNEVLKAVVANYNAGELLTNREQVSKAMRKDLTERAAHFNLILDDVSITHLTFGQEYTRAIESKQVAQQEAERSVYVVERSKFEKQAAVIKAEGEAQAAQLISDALKASGVGLIEVRRIDTAREIAENLAKSRNVTYLPGGEGQSLLLGIN